MGGNLAWTLRLEDGTEYRMDRWTNSMPGHILTPGFLAGEKSAIDEALESWLNMKADWEKNRESEEFEFNMTPVYAPYPYGMRPSEYGLVVTDFVSKTILSLQGYTHLGKLNATRQCYGEHARDMFPGRVEQLEEAAQQGRIASWEFIVKGGDFALPFLELGATIEPHQYDPNSCVVSVPGSVDYDALTALCDQVRDDVPPNPHAADIEEWSRRAAAMDETDPERAKIEAVLLVMQNAHKGEHRPLLFASAVMDLSPFTLEEFPECSKGYEALLDRILELGFEISDDERAAWDERIAREREMEEEDA